LAKTLKLADALTDVRRRIADAAARGKRSADDVTLVAVTKYAPPDAVREILQLGVADVGESHVQQLVQRASQINEAAQRRRLGADAPAVTPRWHMIGRLQRNKIKPLLPLVYAVHSIDTLRLAEEIDTAAAKIDKKIPVLLQVNASEEPQKAGVGVAAALHLGEQIATMPNVQLAGLMTMAAVDAGEKTLRQTFTRVREIFEEMKWHKIGGSGFRHLSMGMSNDFEIAVEEGSTMVRVGSALFGEKADGAEENDE
jgi:pyridoxal phosphate enzyme (YggS family)